MSTIIRDEAGHGLMHRARRVFRRFESERKGSESTWKFTIDVKADPLDGGFVAQIVEMPGAMSQGETKLEAANNAIEALTEIFAARMHDDLPDDDSTESPSEYPVAVSR